MSLLALLALSPSANASKGIVATLGTSATGSVGGLYSTPSGVAVNKTGAGGVAAGTFYVVDRNNRRIQRFSPSGEFVSAWGFDVTVPVNSPAVYEICTAAASCRAGTSGTGPGQFAGNASGGLQSVAVDQATGNVFAADQVNRRISVFTATGTFEGGFGWGAGDGTAALQFCTSFSGCSAPAAAGAAAGQFGASIGGLAIDGSNLYVADKTNRRVDVFALTVNGTSKVVTGVSFLHAFGWGVDTGAAAFEVCTVASTCNAGTAGAGKGQFGSESPTDVAVDGTGNLYALDAAGKRVQQFSSTPEPLVEAFGAAALSAAFGTGSLHNLSYETTAKHLYVSGSNSANASKVAVAELDETGVSVDTHGTALSATTANGLAAAPAGLAGGIYLTTISGGHFVHVLNDVTTPTMDPVTVHTGTTATFSGTVVSNGGPVGYRFEYSSDGGSSWSSYPIPDAAAGSAATTIPVSQNIEGLAGSQLYQVRLRAARQTPGGAVTSTPVSFTTDAASPAVSGEAVSDRMDTSVTLEGAINAQNQATTYHFEYTDQEDFEANGYANAIKAPAPDASAGSGNAPVAVSRAIAGLQPKAKYHFRLVATNPSGTTNGEDRTFLTFSDLSVAQNCPNEIVRGLQGTTFLPECRAIELVNTPDKGNQNVSAAVEDALPMSPDGRRVLWTVNSGAPGGTASSNNTFLAERTASGWISRSLVPQPAQQVAETSLQYLAEKITPDLEHFVFNVGANFSSGEQGKTVVRLDTNQHQDVLATFGTGMRADKGEVSDNGAHVLVINPDNHQLEDIGGATPELISVMPGGLPSGCGLRVEGESFVGGSGSQEAAGLNWRPGNRMMEVEDASRVYFQTKADGSCNVGSPYGLYQRNRESEATTLIDAGAAGKNPEFIRSTPDGRHAYFVTASQLDPADGNAGRDVYRWDEEAAASTCLTCVVPNANVSESPRRVVVSDDFSHVYFQSKEQLVPGKGIAGESNTYSLSNGVINFVGGRAIGTLVFHEAMLSADGNVLLFQANNGGGAAEELTDDDLAAQCLSPPITKAAPTACEQLYVYDDSSGSVECLSCLRGGETTLHVGSGFVNPGSNFRMSRDGSTIAFITLQALLPQDLNQAADVYQWREGKLNLVTDGLHPFQEGFAAPQVRGVSKDGSSILFIAAAPGLTGFEHDGLTNLYVARIGGGFEPPSPAVHCSEDSCQGPLQAPPAQQQPASFAFSGGGNAKAGKTRRRCAKGKVRRRGRCVKRTQKKAHKRASHANQGRTK